MGRSEVRVIRVSKRASAVLLVLATAAIAALLWWLSGRAYARIGAAEVVAQLADSPRAFTNVRVIAALMPIAANLCLFVPWGFLLFVVLDGPSRPRRRSYALTFACGLLFALALAAWQLTLPTRVTTFADAFPNGLGALAGAACGHLRKQVHLRFEA
jgi:glycopeptide antibiotics resistance protein